MKKITRNSFIRQSSMLGALAVSPLNFGLFKKKPAKTSENTDQKNDLMHRLAAANDRMVERILNPDRGDIGGFRGSRGSSGSFALLSASYCCSLSKYYQKAELLNQMEKILEQLRALQYPDGTLDFGNLQSPPDTAFMLESMCPAANLLAQMKSKALNKIREELRSFIVKAGNAVAEGGIHTPNHRWVVSAVLAHVNVLYPDRKYIDRINDWLGEGIYMDEDGEYAERSKNYARVNNSAFIEMGRLLNKPELFEYARKSLRLTYYHMEPNGDVITNNSRRQDQFSTQSIIGSYLFYRYLAIHDNDAEFAAIARLIEGLPGFEEAIINRSLISFLDEPLLQKDLPAPAVLPVSYEKVFPNSHLLRIRRGDITTTLFGGTDWPFIIASGRSHIPDIYSYRKGKAILRHMRVSSRFFSMGYFRSHGLKKEGNKYILYQKLEAPYYHPLPAEYRNPDGDYELTPSIDDRFWSKMNFPKRPVTMKTLETTITLEEINGKNELTFNISGADNVAVTIELCFREGGKLSGVTEADDQNNYFLEEGTGQYQVGEDIIHFGPGTLAHRYIRGLEGEKYSTHDGSLRMAGTHVYLTGMTPFEHKLLFY